MQKVSRSLGRNGRINKTKSGGLTVDVSAVPQDNIEELMSPNSIVQLNEVFSPSERYVFDQDLYRAKQELNMELDRYLAEYKNVKDSIFMMLGNLNDKVNEYKEKRKLDSNSSGKDHINFRSLLSI